MNYTIRINKIQEQGITLYEGTIDELPDISEYGDSVEEVLELITDTIKTTQELCFEED